MSINTWFKKADNQKTINPLKVVTATIPICKTCSLKVSVVPRENIGKFPQDIVAQSIKLYNKKPLFKLSLENFWKLWKGYLKCLYS